MRRAAVIAALLLGCDGDGDRVRLLVPTSTGLLGIPPQITVTDADGTVRFQGAPPSSSFSVAIAPDATVVVLLDASSSPTARATSLTTIGGVQPGDEIDQLSGRTSAQPVVGDMTINFPAAPSATVTGYRAVTPCGAFYAANGRAAVWFTSACLPPGPFDVVVYTLAAPGEPRHILPIRGVTFQDGGTISGTTWEPMPMVAVTVVGLTDQATVDVQRHPAGEGPDEQAPGAPPSAAPILVPAVPQPGDVALYAVTTTRPGTVGFQRHTFGVDAAATALELDLAPHPMPWITAVPRATAADVLTWSTTGSGVPDAAIASSAWSSGGGPPISSGSATSYAPGDVTTTRGAPGDTLRLVDVAAPGGYAAIRHQTFLAAQPPGLGEVRVDVVAPPAVP